MITIVFEPHATSTDNEVKAASGWNDVALSDLGYSQAEDMGERRADEHFDAIFCSDLQRSYRTAELAFGEQFPIIQDKRLRECDYGELTQESKVLIDSQREQHVTTPFPGGESYQQTAARMKEFLDEIAKTYDGKKILVIGHRATQYGLEHWVNHIPLETVVTAPWSWQPGWTYQYSPQHTAPANERFKLIPAVHVLIRRGDEILLHQRSDTAHYQASMYALVSGHLDGDELSSEAMAREIKEEAGIDVQPGALQFAHVGHRLGRGDGQERVDIFFETWEWEGTITNVEPHKCLSLTWFPIANLPEKTVPYIRLVIQDIAAGKKYSEYTEEPV
jgi:broad specificity phosphatase PhoE/8-oxo-dGTP pyrophosphatase MutT (NUDIX family)